MLQLTKKNLSTAACVLGLALAACTSIARAQTPAPGTATAAPGTIAIKGGSAPELAPSTGPRYDNRYEVFGGLSFMNGQAGQNLPRRYNMGGGEVMGTYWLPNHLGSHLGIAADYRIEAGTTPIISPYYNRILVYQNVFSGGVQYRGPKNRYAAVDFHALVGGTHGTFDSAPNGFPGGSPVSSCVANQQPGQRGNLGLYCNSTSPFGAVGGSIDFNYSPKVAIRLSPDMIFEHFGTETREFFSIGGGVVYRIGKRR